MATLRKELSIALVGCSGRSKFDHPATIRLMYTSQLFLSSLALAEALHDVVYVINARHALVTLDQVIEPCDYTTSGMPAHSRKIWGERIWKSILNRHPNEDRQIFIYASNNDIRPIRYAGRHQAMFHEPLAKMRNDQRLRWLREQLSEHLHEERTCKELPEMTYKHEWTLDLPMLEPIYPERNLCVRMERSNSGWRAVLADLAEFRGTGSTQGLAIDDLVDDLERVAAEIRRASTLEELRKAPGHE